MRIGYKVVAIGLMVVALLAPSASLAFCAPVSADATSPMRCPPDCPMMAAMQHATESGVQAAPQRSSCCEMSSGRPAPTSELQVPTDSFRVAAPVILVAAAVAPVAFVEVTDFSSPPPLFASQAILCTFLI